GVHPGRLLTREKEPADPKTAGQKMQAAKEGLSFVDVHQLLRRIRRGAAAIADAKVVQQAEALTEADLAVNQEADGMDRQWAIFVFELEEQGVLDRGQQPLAMGERGVPISKGRVAPADAGLTPAAPDPAPL